MNQEKLIGIIQEDGRVLTNKGDEYFLPSRGRDKEGYREVVIDATAVGGYGGFARQSLKPYIGMEVEFYINGPGLAGFNFTILNKMKGGKNEKE